MMLNFLVFNCYFVVNVVSMFCRIFSIVEGVSDGIVDRYLDRI